MPTVFPSSTSRDLPDERQAVLDTCRALNLAVATMEDFSATGHGATAHLVGQQEATPSLASGRDNDAFNGRGAPGNRGSPFPKGQTSHLVRESADVLRVRQGAENQPASDS